jgi:dCMP deaminase
VTRPTRDEYFVQMLALVASRSTCARRKVGAIIVDERGRVLSMGYNGVPSRFPHCTDAPCEGAGDPPGDTRRCLAVHAEMNAVVQCHRLDLADTLYASCLPCHGCAKVLCNTPVKRVVVVESYADSQGLWVLKRAKVSVVVWDDKK